MTHTSSPTVLPPHPASHAITAPRTACLCPTPTNTAQLPTQQVSQAPLIHETGRHAQLQSKHSDLTKAKADVEAARKTNRSPIVSLASNAHADAEATYTRTALNASSDTPRDSTGKTDRLGPNDSSTMPHSTTRLVSHAPSEFSEWKANSMPTNRTHSDSRKSMPSKQVHEADIAHQLIQDRGEERRADYTCELCTTHEDATNCRSHAIDAKHAGNAEAKAKACQRRDEGAESQHQRQECPTTAAEGPVTSSIETTKSTRSSRPTKHATSRADRSTGCTDCTTIPSPRSTNRLASTLHALHANSKLRPDTICTSGSPTNSTPLDPSSTIPYPRQTEDQSELEGHQQDHQAEPAQQRDH